MSDLISREAAKMIITMRPYDWSNITERREMLNEIDNLPSATPERKWIPVNERLPEEKKYVLVTTIDDDMKVSWVTDVNYWWNIGRGKVIAWMPLPESYKE